MVVKSYSQHQGTSSDKKLIRYLLSLSVPAHPATRPLLAPAPKSHLATRVIARPYDGLRVDDVVYRSPARGVRETRQLHVTVYLRDTRFVVRSGVEPVRNPIRKRRRDRYQSKKVKPPIHPHF